MRIRVTSSNIKCNPEMPQPWVESDIRHVAALGGVVIGQEIEIPRYVDAWKRLMSARRKVTCGITQESPVSLPKKVWDIEDVEIRLTHHGRRTATPNRYIVVVKAKRKGSGRRVAFMGTHYVSGAWNRKPKTFKKWRQTMWLKHYDVQKAWIQELHDEGYTVIVAGDFNKTSFAPFHPDQVDANSHGIDHLFVIPAAGTRARVVEKGALGQKDGLHTDHPAIWAVVDLH